MLTEIVLLWELKSHSHRHSGTCLGCVLEVD